MFYFVITNLIEAMITTKKYMYIPMYTSDYI